MSSWKTSIEILAYPSITPFLDIPKACLSATPGAELQSLHLAGEKTMESDRSRSVSSRQCLPWQHHHRGRTTMKKQGRRREIGKQKHLYMWLYTYIHVYIHTYIYIPWTSQFSFKWHLCKVLVSHCLFTKYFQNWLIDHASIPCASLDGSRGKGSKCSLLITWRILFTTISNHASMIIFGGASAIDFTLQWESGGVNKKSVISAWKPVILAWKWVKKPWFYGHFQGREHCKISSCNWQPIHS